MATSTNLTMTLLETTQPQPETAVNVALNILDAAVGGKHMEWIPARDWQPSATGGCAALATIATSAGQPDIQSLDFDATTAETAQCQIALPRGWNLGTVTFEVVWSHAATTTNFGVAWKLSGMAVSDSQLIAQAFGTAITVTDTGGTTNNNYRSPESAVMTIENTPALHDMILLKVERDPANGSDTMAIDARLHGVRLFWTRTS